MKRNPIRNPILNAIENPILNPRILPEIPFIISVIGAGGKTTCIENMAEAAHKEGKKALVVTTTHMWMPQKHCAVGKTWEEAGRMLMEEGLIYYGKAAEVKDKITFPGQEAYQALCGMADVVLVEADGAKEKPIKLPDWSREPVIPENTNQIILVFGLSALGRPLKEVCHRWELCREFTQAEKEDLVDREMLLRFLQYGYLEPLKLRFPKIPPVVLLNQADDERKRKDGQWIKDKLEGRKLLCRAVQLKSP